MISELVSEMAMEKSIIIIAAGITDLSAGCYGHQYGWQNRGGLIFASTTTVSADGSPAKDKINRQLNTKPPASCGGLCVSAEAG
jgi:hypothetical protein